MVKGTAYRQRIRTGENPTLRAEFNVVWGRTIRRWCEITGSEEGLLIGDGFVDWIRSQPIFPKFKIVLDEEQEIYDKEKAIVAALHKEMYTGG